MKNSILIICLLLYTAISSNAATSDLYTIENAIAETNPPTAQTVVIIQIESGMIRAGLSSGDAPTVVKSQVYAPYNTIENWTRFELELELLYIQLGVNPSFHPVLIADQVESSKAAREKLADIFLNKLQAPRLYIAMDAVLALYATDRYTGIVFHSGGPGEISHAVPVFEGYPLEVRLESLPLGDTSGLEAKIPQTIYSSIMKCDVDSRKDLYTNVVLSGKNTLSPGIENRVKEQIETLAPPTTKVTVIAMPNREYLPWTGGKKLAALLSEGHWATKADIDAKGLSVIHKKFL